MTLELKPVESSNLTHIGYDADKYELHIQFKDGKRHVYKGVPRETFDHMMVAPSKGKFFHAHVRHKFESEPFNANR